MGTGWKRSNKLAFGVAAIEALLVVGTVTAGTVTVRDRFTLPANVFLVGTNGDIDASLSGGAFVNLHTGTFDLEIDRGSGFVPLLTYCTEPDIGVGFDTNPPDAVGLPYNPESLISKPLLAVEAAQLQTLWFNAFALSTTSPLNAAAFQAFVWEVCGDDVFDFGVGDFRLSGGDPFTVSAGALATAWHTNITSAVWTGSTPLEHLESPNSQDFLAVIPEPTSVLLLSVGALLIARRHRNR